MEPLFFKAENELHGIKFAKDLFASMEPLFFKAENARVRKRAPRSQKCFNGAAFFQSGKQALSVVDAISTI